MLLELGNCTTWLDVAESPKGVHRIRLILCRAAPIPRRYHSARQAHPERFLQSIFWWNLVHNALSKLVAKPTRPRICRWLGCTPSRGQVPEAQLWSKGQELTGFVCGGSSVFMWMMTGPGWQLVLTGAGKRTKKSNHV